MKGVVVFKSNIEVIYKVSAYYSPEHDRGPLWNDPALGIAWPVSTDQTSMSEKDRTHPVLSHLPRYFRNERRAILEVRSDEGNYYSRERLGLANRRLRVISQRHWSAETARGQ
jgi:hypothetical protein